MVDNETENSTYSYDYDYEEEFIPSAKVQFWTYLVFEIPSLFCTIYLLYHLTFNQRLRRQLQNHVVMILLFLCLIIIVIDNSFYLDGFRMGNGNSFPFSTRVCLLWWFIDYGFYGAIPVFLVWASFERHILVFYRRQFLRPRRKIFYTHYCPLIIISIYLIGFYVGVILFPPCENIFYSNGFACGSYPCYQDITWINTWDYFFNGVLCNILEAFFTISLLFRTIWKKCISTRYFHWKKYRKMIIQLLSISTLSLSINLPQALIIFVQSQPNMSNFGSTVEPYFFYLTTFVVLFLPIVCFGCLPELWPQPFFCHQRRQGTVAPMILSARP
ncbi:unnamed protein product [Rotaria sordida]|uniref:Uncharacterized protein n=1 Tax=Rotaria sordida TaxID=392033 RepID=A0A819RNY2_9BILA|nr:unnamed protein product [Rotaria sordida]CAF1467309.1 unnamed protein product [Rotaria sordida]CAF1629365.1 unnamed protein product [Rotaria sordida]CAF4055677.1 unnamed protein product [Rotaria sordida]